MNKLTELSAFPVNCKGPRIIFSVFTKTIFRLLIIICLSPTYSPASKSTWNGSSSTAWSTVSNWTATNGGSRPPSASDTVVIVSGSYQPVLPNSSLTLNTLTIQSGTLTQGGNSTNLTVTNNLTVNAGAALNMAGEVLAVNGTLTISGTLSTTGGSGHDYKHVTISNGGIYSTTSSTINVTGNWTNNGTFTCGTSDVYFKGTIAQTLFGNFYTLRIQNGSGGSCNLVGNINVYNDLVLSSGTLSAGSNTITLTHDLTNNGSNFNAQTSTIIFNGTGNQNIDGGSSLNNVIVNGTNNTVQPTGNITINGNLTITSGTFDENAASRTITGNGASNTLRVQAGGTLLIRSAGTTPYATSFPGWETFTLDNGSTIEWATSNSKTWDITSFQNVIISGGTNTLSNSGTTTVTGDLTMTGGSLSASSGNKALTITGDFIMGSNSFSATGSIVTIGGNYTGTGTLNAGTSVFVFNGSGSQSIVRTSSVGNYYSITINKTSGATTITGDITVLGNLSIQSGTLDLGSYTMNRSSSGGTLSVSDGAALKIGSTNSIPQNYSSHSFGSGSTIEYNGSSQTVSAETYDNLVLSGSGTKTSAGSMTVNGDITLSPGITFSAGSYTHSIHGNWTNNGATYSNGNGTINFNGSSVQSISGNNTFKNLTINNSAGITLSSVTTVSGTLTFTSGKITTGSNELNVTNTSASAITGHSSANYVFGNLRRSVSITGSYDFPLGTASNYQLINISLTVALGFSNILGTFTSGNPAPSGLPAGLTSNGKTFTTMLNNGYWSLTPNSAMIAGVYSVTLNAKGYTNLLSSDPLNYIVMKRHDGSSGWGISGLPNLSGHLLSGGVLTTISTGLTSFSDYGEGIACQTTAANAGSDQSICGTSATLAGNTATSGTGSWSIISGTGGTIAAASGETSSFTGTGGSTYSLKWTITDGSCPSSSDTVVISFTGAPTTANAGSDQNICGTSSTLTGNTPSSGTGAWSIISGTGGSLTNSSSPTSSFTGTAGLTYSLRWAISNSPCTTSADTVVVTFIQNPTGANAGTDQNICGTSTALAGNTPVAGTGTWSIINGTGGTISNASNPSSTFTGVAGTSYNLRWTINNSCSAVADEVTVNLNSSPDAIAAASSAVCNSNNGSVSVSIGNGTSPYSYLWSNGSTSQNISNLGEGSYSVSITDANGCSTSASAIVSGYSAAITASVSSTDATCSSNTGSASVSANGGSEPYSYYWSNGSTSQSISGLAAGSYSVSVTDANGCSASASANVSIYSVTINASVTSSNASCSGSNGAASVSVSGGNEPYAYSWSDGSTSNEISGLTAAVYSVTITDANGCTGTSVATIINGSTSFSTSVSSENEICNGRNGSITLTISGGSEPFTFVWSNGASTNEITGLEQGNYSVSISDSKGCTASASAFISNSSSSINSSISNSSAFVCSGSNNGIAEVSASGGATPYNYNWSNGAITQNVSGLSAGSYSVTIADANGCSTTASVTIPEKSAPVQPDSITVTGASYGICPPVNGVILRTNNNPDATSYSWTTESPGVVFAPGSATNVQTVNLIVTSSSTYTVRVTASNACGTSPIRGVGFRRAVGVPDLFGPAVVCPNSNQTYSCNKVGASTYKWTGTAGMLFNGSPGPYITSDTSVNVSFASSFNSGILYAAGTIGCFTSAYKTLTITKNMPALGIITGTTPVCPQSSQTYTVPPVQGAVSYSWTMPLNATGSSTINSIAVNFGNFTAAGNLCVQAVNSCGVLSGSKCFAVSPGLPATPGTVTGPTTQVCGTKTYSVTAVNGITYDWTAPLNASISGGQGTNSVTIIFTTGFTSGSLTVKASNSCGNSAPRALSVSSAVAAPGTITGQYTYVCAGISKNYSVPAVSGINFNWTAPANAVITSGQGTNIVTVTFNSGFISGNLSVIATNGCANSLARTLVISSLPVAPGAISGECAQVCGGTSKTYSVIPANGVTYNWTAPANAVVASGQGTNNVIVNFNNGFTSGTLSVVAVSPCGSGPARTLSITSLLTSPASITGSPYNNCGATAVFTTKRVANATLYIWSTNIPGAVIAAVNDTAASVSFPSFISGSISVGAMNACGTGPLKSLTVAGAPPTPGLITTNPSPVCANATGVQFSCDVSILGYGCIYMWTYPSTATYVSGQGTPDLVLNWGSVNGAISMKASNGCGTSVRSFNVIIGCTRVAGGQGQNTNEDVTTPLSAASQSSEPGVDTFFNLQAYPDRDQRTLTFTFNAPESGSYNYSIYDDSNREIQNGTIDAQEGVNMQEIDMASLPSNTIYRLKLDNGTKSTHINIKMQ